MTARTSRPSALGGDHGALSAVLLPPVVQEASVAVLVVDLHRREVTFANELAEQLAPSVALPVPVDEWSAAAGLEDVAGDDLPGGPGAAASRHNLAESLLRIAQGQPVTGEAVTAQRATAVTVAREVLWVLGLPLVGAPEPMSSLALVVFLPARNARLVAGAQETAANLRDRAVLATRVSFTITDPTQPDDPLIWVNPAFTATTGYSFDEAVGRNCRFLQGEHTDRRVVAEIRRSLREQRPLTTTLRNYRKDGTAFWNELSISPIRDHAGVVTHFVGVQADVTARVEAQQARDEALSQVAQAADRLALLADFTSQMAMSSSPQQVVDLLGEVLVPRLGTWCVVFTYDTGGRLVAPHIVHERAGSGDAVAAIVARLRGVVPEQLLPTGPVWRVLRGEDPYVLVGDYDAEPRIVSGAADDVRTDLVHELGVRSVAAVPLLARGGILGCVIVITDDARAPLDDADLALARDLAVRAGLMLENTQLFARDRAAAATLQRSLLPRLPLVPGLEVAASYVPAADEAAVGGDWYDVFPLRGAPSGGVAVVVGDVMGHDIDSAARMGKLSTIVRAYGWPGSDPREVLTGVDELLVGGNLDFLATCFYAKLTQHASGATLRYSSAGHPPAIVRAPDGSTTLLDHGRGPMIGVSALTPSDRHRPEDATVELQRGSTVICFTDGLVDAFAAEPDIDAGLAELRRLTAALPVDASPQTIVDKLTHAELRHKDDVAVVAIRIG